MSIIYETGDLLEANADIICQQVNCKGKMGAGLAKQIREKYPIVHQRYVKLCDRVSPKALLGAVDFEETDSYIIANCFAQLGYARSGLQTDYNALKICFESVKKFAKEHGMSDIALPYKIGCGLAGGDWNIVKELIEDVFECADLSVKIVRREE